MMVDKTTVRMRSRVDQISTGLFLGTGRVRSPDSVASSTKRPPAVFDGRQQFVIAPGHRPTNERRADWGAGGRDAKTRRGGDAVREMPVSPRLRVPASPSLTTPC